MQTEIHWLQVLIGWLGGIPTAVLAQWLYRKYFGKKYFNVTYISGDKRFIIEGEPPKTVNLERLIKTMFGKNKYCAFINY